MVMKFEVLSMNHVRQLLDFELENRSWFESLIEPRDNSFYSEQGVGNHIKSLICDMKNDTAYCGVLVYNNKIIARANLKDIAKQYAFVGYRVSKQFISRGCASYCLSQLIEVAINKLGIKTLDAHVLENNPASKRVLEKYGFIEADSSIPFIIINNEKIACTCFRLTTLQQNNK